MRRRLPLSRLAGLLRIALLIEFVTHEILLDATPLLKTPLQI